MQFGMTEPFLNLFKAFERAHKTAFRSFGFVGGEDIWVNQHHEPILTRPELIVKARNFNEFSGLQTNLQVLDFKGKKLLLRKSLFLFNKKLTLYGA